MDTRVFDLFLARSATKTQPTYTPPTIKTGSERSKKKSLRNRMVIIPD